MSGLAAESGAKVTGATVTRIQVSRYADYPLLYQQAQILARQGIKMSRAVLAGWLGAAARQIAPGVQRLHAILQTAPPPFVDETTMPVLDRGTWPDEEGLRLGDRPR